MNNIKISRYWKYQMIGWSTFVGISLLFAILNEPIVYVFSRVGVLAIMLMIEGVAITHLMRGLLKKLGILQKRLTVQAYYFFAFTFLFSVLLVLTFNFTSNPRFFSYQLVRIFNGEKSHLNVLFFHLVLFGGAILIWNLIYFLVHYVKRMLIEERMALKREKEMMELEANALRAQMNPHFIFNSMNSIKSLINKNENEAAANYLTTFSKLIRTLFQNSDKREVSLYEELETCKLYTQLEKMRFGNKVDFVFDIDQSVDMKDIKVPALIIQPIIENAIWHGLAPKELGGKVVISVKEKNGAVQCSIDDDGIGRVLSKSYKTVYESAHQSKGIGLTQSRLELDKVLNEREDSMYIIDKEGKDGKPGGTQVIITFKENGN